MTQAAIAVSTTPPLPGLQLVQEVNAALEALATDFSGNTDPAAFAKPFSTWIDTSGTNPILKRRNAANTAWVSIGNPFQYLDAATQALYGVVRLSQQAEAAALTTNDSVLTPATLAYAFTANQGTNSFKLPGGKIFQYGVVSGTGDFSISFPTAFPTVCRAVHITPRGVLGGGLFVGAAADDVTNSGCTVRFRAISNGGAVSPSVTFTASYLAIGE